jgi:23S rRNA pseudoU1915 N3-methylase RlmH
MEKIMAESQAALAKSDEKRSLEKESSNAIYLNLNLTKEAIEVQRLDVEVNKADAKAKMRDAEGRRMDAEAKIWAKDTRIVLADLGSMDDETRALFLKKRAKTARRMIFVAIVKHHGFLDYIYFSSHVCASFGLYFVPHHVHNVIGLFQTSI